MVKWIEMCVYDYNLHFVVELNNNLALINAPPMPNPIEYLARHGFVFILPMVVFV